MWLCCAVESIYVQCLKHFHAVYADMVFVYSFCSGNGRAVAAVYWQQYLHCRVPYHFQFPKVYRTLRETFSFSWGNAEHEQQSCGEDSVLDAVQWSPRSSVHSISMMTVTLTQVWRILHIDGICLYRLERVQHLLLEDHAPHVQCCEWLQAHLNIVLDILFMDEAQYTCDGINNKWNF